MRLIIGLGNPGRRYAATRHNVGFRVLETWARRRGLVYREGAGPWLEAADVASGLVLLKPLTYMNRSGEAVVDWSRYRGRPVTGSACTEPLVDAPCGEPADPGVPDAAPLRPLVVCDDLALPVGAVRLRTRGGSGGQNGLASLIACLGGEEFPRMRLGIAPTATAVPAEEWADYVLAEFAADEVAAVADAVDHAVAALEWWTEHGLEAAASRFNRRGPSAPEG